MWTGAVVGAWFIKWVCMYREEEGQAGSAPRAREAVVTYWSWKCAEPLVGCGFKRLHRSQLTCPNFSPNFTSRRAPAAVLCCWGPRASPCPPGQPPGQQGTQAQRAYIPSCTGAMHADSNGSSTGYTGANPATYRPGTASRNSLWRRLAGTAAQTARRLAHWQCRSRHTSQAPAECTAVPCV